MLAVQVDGAEVSTVEGLGEIGRLHPLQAPSASITAFDADFALPEC
jgi:aerobic-type carbon monoxide dehydrogenase small subunit (CoxS/CutS family)